MHQEVYYVAVQHRFHDVRKTLDLTSDSQRLTHGRFLEAIVTPRSRGYGDVTAMYIRRQKYPYVYMLSISTGKNQSAEAQWSYTFQQKST